MTSPLDFKVEVDDVGDAGDVGNVGPRFAIANKPWSDVADITNFIFSSLAGWHWLHHDKGIAEYWLVGDPHRRLTASSTLPTRPTKLTTPNQGLPTSTSSEPPQRPASAPATMWPQPDTTNPQTISLPNGWEKKCIGRPDGKNKDRWDFTLRPPNGNQLGSQAQLLEYTKKYPDILHDATVTHICRPWTSSYTPADTEIIEKLPNLTKSAAPKSPAQPPRSPRGRNSRRLLSQAASRNLVTDIYVKTQ